jgi:peroxiredoxin (alkyl hydroperoxide reductase subunit C)
MLLINKEAPNFKANAVFKNEIKQIELADYKQKYVLLFFYPLDFTFVCPTELHAFQDQLEEFKKRNVEVLGCSVDSPYTHLAWLETPKEKGGIAGVEYGIIADLGGKIGRTYDVLAEDKAFRASFLIDKAGIVRHQMINDLGIGRNVHEALRIIDALQHTEKHGEVCPANWQAGKQGIKANKESTGEYLKDKQN